MVCNRDISGDGYENHDHLRLKWHTSNSREHQKPKDGDNEMKMSELIVRKKYTVSCVLNWPGNWRMILRVSKERAGLQDDTAIIDITIPGRKHIAPGDGRL